ncbi:TPA: hypothetical protein ACOEF8_002384 [Enterobacter roggenkampii]
MELLITLGKRTEKILYSSIFVMTVTWSFNYFSKAILFTQNSNPEAYRILYDSINNDLHSLTESYKILSDKIKLEDPLEKNKKKQAREMLGLPPQSKEKTTKNYYKEELDEIANKVSSATGIDIKNISTLLDYNKPPDELLKLIKDKEKETSNKSINIWGIESPSRILFNYGGSNYIITNSLAATLLAFIAPVLIVIWLGSFYLTRHREISIIDDIEDYRITHPHILNLFYLNPEKFSRDSWENRFINTKGKKKEKAFTIHMISIFRATFILMLLSLVIFPYINGVISLIMGIYNSIFIISLHVLLIITIVIQSLITIIQEKTSLKKTFETKVKDY